MKTKFTDGFNRTKTRARFRMSNANMSYRQLGKSAAHAPARQGEGTEEGRQQGEARHVKRGTRGGRVSYAGSG